MFEPENADSPIIVMKQQLMLSCTKVMLFTWIFLCNDI